MSTFHDLLRVFNELYELQLSTLPWVGKRAVLCLKTAALRTTLAVSPADCLFARLRRRWSRYER